MNDRSLPPVRPPVEIFDEVILRLRERQAAGLPPVKLEHSPRERLEAQAESILFMGGGVLGLASVGDLSGARAHLVEVLALGVEALEAFDRGVRRTLPPPPNDERLWILGSLRRLLASATGRIATCAAGTSEHARHRAHARHLILWIAALESDLAGMVAHPELAAAIFAGVPDLADRVPELAAAIAADLESPR